MGMGGESWRGWMNMSERVGWSEWLCKQGSVYACMCVCVRACMHACGWRTLLL